MPISLSCHQPAPSIPVPHPYIYDQESKPTSCKQAFDKQLHEKIRNAKGVGTTQAEQHILIDRRSISQKIDYNNHPKIREKRGGSHLKERSSIAHSPEINELGNMCRYYNKTAFELHLKHKSIVLQPPKCLYSSSLSPGTSKATGFHPQCEDFVSSVPCNMPAMLGSDVSCLQKGLNFSNNNNASQKSFGCWNEQQFRQEFNTLHTNFNRNQYNVISHERRFVQKYYGNPQSAWNSFSSCTPTIPYGSYTDAIPKSLIDTDDSEDIERNWRIRKEETGMGKETEFACYSTVLSQIRNTGILHQEKYNKNIYRSSYSRLSTPPTSKCTKFVSRESDSMSTLQENIEPSAVRTLGEQHSLQLFVDPNDSSRKRSLPDVGFHPTVSESELKRHYQTRKSQQLSVDTISSSEVKQRVQQKQAVPVSQHNRNNFESNHTPSSPMCSDSHEPGYSWPRTIFYGVVDGQFEQLCRQLNAINDSSTSDKNSNGTSSRKRNRVIFCRICQQFKPRSTRARFQSCDHIACYDCVRIALHVEFWAVKNNYPEAPRATCPVCRTELDWSTIKPYIVLAEEAKYLPVLTLAALGKDIPPNTPSHRSLNNANAELDAKDFMQKQVANAKKRLEDARRVVEAFFPKDLPRELLISDIIDFSEPLSSQYVGCAQQLFSQNDGWLFVDRFDSWRSHFSRVLETSD